MPVRMRVGCMGREPCDGRPVYPWGRGPPTKQAGFRRPGIAMETRSERLAEIPHFAVGAIAIPSVALLQLAGQVLRIALGDVEVVVGQVAPLGLGLALHL